MARSSFHLVVLLVVSACGASESATGRSSVGDPKGEQVNAEQPAPTPAEEWPDIEFAIRSQPPGAKVREGDHTLCTTPCNVRHPSWAPETRSLVLELDAHEPLSLEVHHDDLTYDVALVPVPVTRPRPKPPTRPAPARKPPPKPKTKLRLSR